MYQPDSALQAASKQQATEGRSESSAQLGVLALLVDAHREKSGVGR